MRNEQIKSLTMKMLSRLNPPRAMASNPEAMKSEVEFLIGRINALAPNKNYGSWFEEFEVSIFENLESRTWPTSKEISKAAQQIAPQRLEFRDMTGDNKGGTDAFKINANRIKRGESVCETYVNGKLADELVKRGLITDQDLAPYREAIGFAKRMEAM